MTFPLGDHYDYQSYFKIGWFFFLSRFRGFHIRLDPQD